MIKKLKYLIYRYVFRHRKYDFEEFLPNSKSSLTTSNKLIKTNIRNFSNNLLNVYKYFNKIEIVNLNELTVDEKIQTKLKMLFDDCGSDKSIHGYHILYSSIFNKLSKFPIILEIGIGSTKSSIPSNMGNTGKPGASLMALSKFFPNSQIFGADVDYEILKDFNNVKTFYLDQNDLNSYSNKVINDTGFDLIIDDGLHMQSANLNTLYFALERLNPGGYLVIEDISFSALNTWHIAEGLLKHPFNLNIYKCFDNYVVVVNNKTDKNKNNLDKMIL